MTARSATARKRLTAEQREEQLLDVAEELFTAGGFEGVSLEDIARAAGVTRPTVYQHHGSKDGIFLACVRRARHQFQAQLWDQLSSTEELSEMIRRAGRTFFEFIEQDPRRWMLLFTSSASTDSDLGEQLTVLRFETVDQMAALGAEFVPAMARADVQALAHCISGAAEQLGRWWIRTQGLTIDEIVDRFTTVVLALSRAWFTDYGPGDSPLLLTLPTIAPTRLPT